MRDGRLISEAVKRGKAEPEEDRVRFRETFRKVERGTVIAGERIVWGFPHIKRIFTIDSGVKRNMEEKEIFAEEKIDGFNVRIAMLGGKILGFSRGGFLDLFVTEKAREMGLEKFFKAHPEKVLCAEMIGNTPYTSPTDDFDVRLFVFDIDLGDGSYMPPQQKYDVLKKHSIASVPFLGRFKAGDYKGLQKLAIMLNKGRKEGMVLKSADRKSAVKYVTPWSDIEDISRNVRLFFDMPIGFYYQRVLRSAFFISDFGLDRDAYSAMLGRAFYEGLTKAVRDAKEGREIDEEFEILVKDPKIWDSIRKNMSKEVRIEVLSRKAEGARTRIRFRKIYKKTTRTLASYALGKGITD